VLKGHQKKIYLRNFYLLIPYGEISHASQKVKKTAGGNALHDFVVLKKIGKR
jgi:hypothetical protein